MTDTATTDDDRHSPDPYYIARAEAHSALKRFLKNEQHSLTYTQGAPLDEALETIKTDLHALYDEDHKAHAERGASAISETLETHGDTLSLAQGRKLARIAENLRRGEY